MDATQLATIITALTQGRASGNTDHGLCMVVADRGHVWQGRARDDGDYTIITNARIVRRWGTEKGLNQLANDGPLADTILDAPADVKVARKAIIAIVPCSEAAWNDK